jgi:hypothetical protein
MASDSFIPEGCFFLARQIFDSAIWRDDPHVLKLFIYLLGKARHKEEPKKYPGFEINRGELVTSLSQIADDNEFYNRTIKKWSRAKVSRMMQLLKEQEYIKILADTYGTHISICNYDRFQSLDNYKADSNETQVKRKCNASETQVSINNNGKKGNNEKKGKNIKTFSSDSVEYRLAEFFLSEIRKNNPDHKEPNLQKWSKTFDLIIRLDGKNEKEIANLIRWCQKDSFEMSNVLCPDKLRKRWDNLYMKSQKRGVGNSRTDRNAAAKEQALRELASRHKEKEVNP